MYSTPNVMPMLTLSTPAGSPRSVATLAIDGLQFLEIASDRVKEALAGFGQRQLPRAALKQADPEIALQHRDVAAHRGRRQRQPPRGGGKPAGFGASDEGFEVCERFHGSHFQAIIESNYSHYQLITQQ